MEDIFGGKKTIATSLFASISVKTMERKSHRYLLQRICVIVSRKKSMGYISRDRREKEPLEQTNYL